MSIARTPPRSPPGFPGRHTLAALAAALLAGCGGGGGSGGPSTTPAAGQLMLAGCVIAENATTCQASISWSVSNAASPRIVLGAATLSTAASGTVQAAVGGDRVTVTLFDGSIRLDERSVAGTCVAASAWNGAQCVAFASRKSERAPTPFVENATPVSLEVVVYRPFGTGPHPVVMFHHGSTGNGDNPALFGITFENQAIARFFTQRGWVVAFPQRRGRGLSGGTYDEGFEPDRSRYSCSQGPALAGVERALEDADAALEHVKRLEGVDVARIVSGGTSRGGILAVAHAARRKEDFRAAVNFVGGWLGEGCADSVPVNRATFTRGASFPAETIWLYGQNDPFYSIAHSRGNHDAFSAAGGSGRFLVHDRGPSLNGHFIIDDPQRWGGDVDAFLARISAP